MRIRPAVFILACTIAAVACGAAITTSPSQTAGSLRLTARISQALIASNGTATITFVLENSGSDTVNLTFSDSCQISPYIARSSGPVVYPEGGSWMCATVVTHLSLPPHASKTVDLQLRAAAQASYPYVALAPGQYSAYATVKSDLASLKSDPVVFTVQ